MNDLSFDRPIGTAARRCRVWFSALLFSIVFISAHAQVGYIDSLKASLSRLNPGDTVYANTLNEIAFTYWSVSADSVISLSERAKTLSQRIGFLKGEAEAVKNIGIGHWIKGQYDEALKYYFEALPLAERARYDKGISGCYNNIAIIYNNQGRFDDALKYHAKALEIRERMGDQKGVSYTYNNIGVIYEYLGKYSQALEYQLKGLRIREKIGDKVGIAMSLNNVANLYGYMKQSDKALDYHTKALLIREQIGDKQGIAMSLDNLGVLHMNLGNNALAREYFFASLKVAGEVQDDHVMGDLLKNIAVTYFRERDIGKAMEYFTAAKSKMEKRDDKPGVSTVLTGLAECYLFERNFPSALSAAKESLRLAEQTGSRERIRSASEILSKIYEAMGRGMDALYHHKKFKLYSDSISNKETERRTALLQAQYEYEKKEVLLKEEQMEKELRYEQTASQQRWIIFSVILVLISVTAVAIAVYRSRTKIQSAYRRLEIADNEIRKQKEQLEIMNGVKERLLSVVSHDARSPLNALRGILNLLSQNALSADEARQMFSSINLQVGQLMHFLETLLHWVKNQLKDASADIQPFQLQPIVGDTVELLMPIAQNKNINLSMSIDGDIQALADQEMIRIVVRNLVSNALKFCKDGDTVQVVADVDAARKYVKISVSDTGVGISQQNLTRLFGVEHLTTKGTSKEMGTGLGLMLCKQYVELNGGELGVVSEEGKGSTFWFMIPLAEVNAEIVEEIGMSKDA